jgi:hypothetical protein
VGYFVALFVGLDDHCLLSCETALGEDDYSADLEAESPIPYILPIGGD